MELANKFSFPYYLATLVFLVSTLAGPTCCLSSGAPAAACVDLIPNQNATAQNASTVPYELILTDFLDPSGLYQYVPGMSYSGNSYILFD